MSRELALFESLKYHIRCIDPNSSGMAVHKAIETSLKALEIIKELFDFGFALRFGDNQPMLMIINKRTNEYWELPIPKEKFDLLKEALL